MKQVSETQITWFRLRRSGLVRPLPTPEAVAERLVGVQAQLLPAAAVALWNRVPQLTYADFERRLYEERSLVKLWGQRGTLHLYQPQDWPLIHAALSGQRSFWQRRLEKSGGDLGAYLDAVDDLVALLRKRETLGRSDLRSLDLGLEDELLSSWGGIFYEMVHRGHACHAAPDGSESRFAHRQLWLPDLVWEPPGEKAANVALARRYLHAYGPATVRDFAYWRGTTMGNGRGWLAALGDEVIKIDDHFLLARDLEAFEDAPPPRDAWPVHLLYRYDPLLLAHKDKSWLLDMTYYKRVWRVAGIVEGTVLVGGRLVGTWRYERKAGGLTVLVELFETLEPAVETAVREQAGALAAFFDLPLTEVQM